MVTKNADAIGTCHLAVIEALLDVILLHLQVTKENIRLEHSTDFKSGDLVDRL